MEVRSILNDLKFNFKKALGQNFITDTNLLDAIVCDAEINENDVVIEIGTGAGTLTRALSKKAKKVFSFEVDRDLKEVLDMTLSGLENVEVIFADILKLNDEQIKEIVDCQFKVVANLPYYITTPLIMRFIESNLDVKSLTVMVQKEVAERLCAKENTVNYGAITASVRLRAVAQITRIVKRQLFHPMPNVDSAIIKLDIDRYRFQFLDEKTLLTFIKSCFLMRRKTLANNVASCFNIKKDEFAQLLMSLNFKDNIRGEILSIEDMIAISDKIFSEFLSQ